MNFTIQPVLENETVILFPLNNDDFEALHLSASNPEIWEQHPNKNRYKREVFANFFEGAMQSKGAFKVLDKRSNKIVGTTRFYGLDENERKILIGYTFYEKNCWGKGINQRVKRMMLDYIFNYISEVIFHVGASNIRSQIAMDRLGATKIEEQEVAYFGEETKLNFVYSITKNDWLRLREEFH